MSNVIPYIICFFVMLAIIVNLTRWTVRYNTYSKALGGLGSFFRRSVKSVRCGSRGVNGRCVRSGRRILPTLPTLPDAPTISELINL